MPRMRVRARALDMLGRQQMAGIPSAIHELFKNAHDAYADTVRVDFFRASGILVLWDDGVGMTHDDFVERWLTLGTESKVGTGAGLSPPYRDPKKPERPILGEKGIGRLAIATIGPQVLIITRAEREDGLHQPVASFINWSFFEAGAVNLEEIQISVESVTGKILPDEKLLLRMVRDTESNLDVIRKKLPLDLASRIQADLQFFRDNMPDILRTIGNLPIIDHRGTAFLILPVDPILEHDIDEQNDEELPAPVLKTLRGFSNTMMPSDNPPPMVASFYDHRRDGKLIDLIGDEEFFTPEEFHSADQHFEGIFDEYGQFTGTVMIYREEPANYTVPWDGARGEPTRCGPFRVKIAYLQGMPKETLLPQEEFARMIAKLKRFGGLYVYRDGVRVLPYGNSDYDFLNIERRRTKSASDWFFSYRRLFGAVELTREHNGTLVEKAGREGFRENLAYRQFRAILENFFKRLAVDWFREDTATYGNFQTLKDEVKRRAELIEKREKQSGIRRKSLKDRVDSFFEEVEQGVPARDTLAIRQSLDERLNHILTLSPEDAAREFLRLEAELNEAVHALRERFKIPRPRSLALTRSLQKDVERSASVTLRLEAELFTPLEREIDERISGAVTDARALVSRHRRIKLVIQTRETRDTRKAKRIVRDTRLEAEGLSKEVLRQTRKSLSTVDQAFKSAVMELEREQLADLEEEEARQFGLALEERLNTAVTVEVELLERIRDQIQAVLEAVREGISLDETTAAYEERSKILEEQLDHYTELAQLGTAIGIIQHEFNATVDSLHQGLKDLRSWAVSNPETEKTYNALRSNFEHLDAYLAMFRPLRRRLYRKAVAITGKMIRTYLLEIFGDRFKRHRVDWKTSEAFEMHTVKDYPSVFLPPFVNIVDNALFWLTRDSTGQKLEYDEPRTISFDAYNEGFLVTNNGPGIEERDADRIFEMAFTRKLRGLGMGLAIARKALREAGYDIRLETIGRNTHPCFRITTVRRG